MRRKKAEELEVVRLLKGGDTILGARQCRLMEIYAGQPKETITRLERDLEKAVLPGPPAEIHQGLSNWLDMAYAARWRFGPPLIETRGNRRGVTARTAP